MYQLTTITNQISKQTCTIQGGKPTDKSVVYATKYVKHNIYWASRDQLSNHFNRHRSDIRCYQDLKISILEKVKGPEAERQFKEDLWIIQSDRLYPNGLNMHLSDFGCLYKLLFK